MQPLISVIIPVYKVELYLRECIDSVLAQTYQNLEVILVDDGSPDQCGSICEQYAEKDNRVCVIHKENGGLSDARNAGIDVAKGEYIGFVDSDDWVAPDMYECLYKASVEYNAEIVVCGYYDCWRGKYHAAYHSDVQIYENEEGMEALLWLKIGNYSWNKLYKRELWTKDIRFPKGKVYEDVRTTYRVVQKSKTIVSIPEIKYYYRRRNDGITGSNQVKNKVECVLSRIERFEEVAEAYPNQREFMLKNIFEYIFPLRNAICMQDEKLFKQSQKEIDTVTGFLYRHQSELFSIYRFGVLGRLSYRFICMGNRNGWQLSARVDRISQFKEKIRKLPIIKKWKSIFWKIKRYGNLSYYYKYCMRLPLKKAIFIESRSGKDLAGNLFQVAQEACCRKIKVYLSVKEECLEKVNTILQAGDFSGLKIVIRSSRKYYKALGTSKYWLIDMCLDYDAIKRPDQIFINTWHGTPLKMLEFDIKNKRHMMGGGSRDHLKCDYLVVPSRFLFEILLKSANTEPLFNGKALYCGYPRNSVFFDETERQRVRREKALDGREVFAYLPTWRGTYASDIYTEYSMKKILDFLESNLQENQLLFVKLHNFSRDKIDYSKYQKVCPFPDDVDTYTMLNAVDCLITDYSSVFFDYANTKRKVILFAYDHKEYLGDRGLYFPLEDMPFPKVYNYEELALELNINKAYDDTEFLERFCTYDCLDASKKLLAAVVDGEQVCQTGTVLNGAKKNILIYDAKVVARHLDDSKVRNILSKLDVENANYFYGFRQDILGKTPAFLQDLPDGIRVFTLTSNVIYTLGEKIAKKFFGKEVGRALVKREISRQFGGKIFDEVRILDENEYDPFCKMLKEIER